MESTMADWPTLLSTQQACEYLNVNASWMKRARDNRLIPFTRVGRLARYHRADLDAFLARNRVEAAD